MLWHARLQQILGNSKGPTAMEKGRKEELPDRLLRMLTAFAWLTTKCYPQKRIAAGLRDRFTSENHFFSRTILRAFAIEQMMSEINVHWAGDSSLRSIGYRQMFSVTSLLPALSSWNLFQTCHSSLLGSPTYVLNKNCYRPVSGPNIHQPKPCVCICLSHFVAPCRTS